MSGCIAPVRAVVAIKVRGNATQWRKGPFVYRISCENDRNGGINGVARDACIQRGIRIRYTV
jgi:hypothetical protein